MIEDPTRLPSRIRACLNPIKTFAERHWARLPRGLRLRWPWIFLCTLFIAHFAINAMAWNRIATPTQTFHDDDVRMVQYAMVLSGQASGYSLPLIELQPAEWEGQDAQDLLRASLRNPEERINSYKNTAPIWFITSSILPTVVGISPLSVRLGPLLVLMLLAAALYGAGRKVVDKPAGPIYAAVFITLVPVGWQGAQVGGVC